jgi:hypothetical protein
MRFALYTMAAGLAVAVSAAPAMAFGRGGAVRGAAVGPAGGARAGGVHGGTYTGPRGNTVQHVGGGGVAVGPYGGVHAGAGGATRVTGPGGQSVTHASGGRVTAGPYGGVSASGGAGTGFNGVYGSAAIGHRGGVAVGPGGGVVAGGSRGGIAAGPAGGVVAGGSRGGIVAAPWSGIAAGGYRGGVAIGPGGSVVAGGARVVGHTTGYMSPTYVRGAAIGVRTGYYPYFNRTWYAGHVGAWVAPRWVPGYNLWVAPVWTSIAAFCAITAPPVVYDYGSTVIIQDDNVYVNGDPVGTAADYATQATAIADTGRTAQLAENDDWQPLGVFGLIQGDEKVAQRIFQLAVNKDGVVRGNYYDAVADSTTPVYGSVDKKSQRVAWSIGEKKDIVFETGLPNLTKDESTILIHYGKDRTEEQILARLPQPKDGK